MDRIDISPPSGTRSIQRTLSVLRMVAERKEIGWRLTDLASRCQLDNATAYRILACLAAEGMVSQRITDKRYVPGPTLFELALSVPGYDILKSSLHPELERIANHFQAIALLFLRSGDETVCIDRTKSFTVRPLTVIGTRRLIAESAAGISILMRLPQTEQARLIDAAENRVQRASTKRTLAYRTLLRRSRRYGFGVNKGDIVKGLAGVGFPLTDRSNRPFAAIGIMGATAQFTKPHLMTMAEYMRSTIEDIERRHANLIASLSRYPMTTDAPIGASRQTRVR